MGNDEHVFLFQFTMDTFIVKIFVFLALASAGECLRAVCDDTEYHVLDDSMRNAETGGYADLCDVETTWTKAPDWRGPGWYRMKEPAGTMIPENPVNVNQCGTYSPGWLNGTHPKTVGETVKQTICFNFEGHYDAQVSKNDPICYRRSQIEIKKLWRLLHLQSARYSCLSSSILLNK